MSKTALFFLTIVLASCHVGPEYLPPTVEVAQDWKGAAAGRSCQEICENWWEVFHDPVLNQLIEEAFSYNPSLDAAVERIVQARSLTRIAAADFYPQINLQPNYGNMGVLTKLFGVDTLVREHQLTYLLPITISYEIDFWGRIRDTYCAALYNEVSVEWDYETALLLLASDLAAAYFDLRGLDLQIVILKETIANREKSYKITSDRYAGKITNYSDVARAGLELANAKTQLLETERLRTLRENQIAVLIGETASCFTLDLNPLAGEPPQIPAGLPCEVVKRRPDIASAEMTMASEFAKIGAAYAGLFPSFVLTGALGFSSPLFKDFMSWRSRYWAMGEDTNLMLFDGGRLYSIIDLRVAGFQEALANYRQTVLAAFQDVENALNDIEQFAGEQKTNKIAVKEAETALRISMDRYVQGVANYIEVTISQEQELAAALTDAQLLSSRYLAAIQLIKALGGGWEEIPMEEYNELEP